MRPVPVKPALREQDIAGEQMTMWGHTRISTHGRTASKGTAAEDNGGVREDLRTAIEREMRKVRTADLTRAVGDLSRRYRETAGTGAPLIRTPLDVAAYAAYRLPATLVAIRAALVEAREAQPDLDPHSMLDVGGGPGTAAWAALDVWPGLARITILERDRDMIRLGRALSESAESTVLREARWHLADITGPWDTEPADLLVSGYVIGELTDAGRDEVVQRIWEHTQETCVLVEPGTPRGYRAIEAAAVSLVAAGASIVAPVPAGWTCLAGEGDWLHFGVRVPRTRMHRLAKGSELSYEDEKYAYLVASRRPGRAIAARVIRRPQVRQGHLRLLLCTAEGVREVVVTRKNRSVYHWAKDLQWGSAIWPEEGKMLELESTDPASRT